MDGFELIQKLSEYGKPEHTRFHALTGFAKLA